MAQRHRPSSFVVDSLEKRQLFAAAHPVAINFNDEALFDSQFPTAMQQAKNLGVTSVRLWMGVNNWDVRPNVWDPVPAFGAVAAGETTRDNPYIGSPARVLRRAFELQREGFSVMIIMTNAENAEPAPPEKVQAFLRHILPLTETPETTKTLAEVVDFWEVGNEPDLGHYWKPSAANKTLGLQRYVNEFLIPAADVLHDPANGVNEKVVSGGPSWSANDLKTILDELTLKNRLDAIDFAGFHPYGEYDPSRGINAVGERTTLAKQYADAVGKPLIATEWNIRGFGNLGANDAQWAAAADEVYRNIILPNYHANYYFALVNNWAARGGTTSARPGGLLKHESPIAVTPSSPTLDLRAYYNSPLVKANPFYDMYDAWQYGSVSGVVANSRPNNAPSLPQATVYLDKNKNGRLDDAEPYTLTATDGSYTLQYGTRQITAGTYHLRVVTPTGWLPDQNAFKLDVANLAVHTGVSLTLRPQPQVRTVGGMAFDDTDGDGVCDAGEAALAGVRVWLDIDGDGLRADTEPTALSSADGTYAITYDALLQPATTATLRFEGPIGTTPTRPSPTIDLVIGGTSIDMGLYGIVSPPPTPSAQTIQAETGIRSGGVATFSTHAGFTGTGFADYAGQGSAVQWSLNWSQAGYATIAFRYANGGATHRPLAVQVNGVNVGSIACTPTGSWTTWGTASITVSLTAGSNVIKATASSGAGGANVDSLTISPTTAPPPPPPPPRPTTGSLSGYAFNDTNANGKLDGAETRAAGKLVFLDANNNGAVDTGEKQVTTDAQGNYAFTGLAAGTYAVRRTFPKGYTYSTPPLNVALTTGQSLTDLAIGSRRA